MTHDLVLDTHILIWLINGDAALKSTSKNIIKEVCKRNLLLVPAISIWEIAMLKNKGRIKLTQPLQQWVKKVSSLPYLKIVPLDEAIALESCKLPGDFHGDPADRMIIATARILDTPLMTKDKKIIDYGKQLYLKVI